MFVAQLPWIESRNIEENCDDTWDADFETKSQIGLVEGSFGHKSQNIAVGDHFTPSESSHSHTQQEKTTKCDRKKQNKQHTSITTSTKMIRFSWLDFSRRFVAILIAVLRSFAFPVCSNVNFSPFLRHNFLDKTCFCGEKITSRSDCKSNNLSVYSHKNRN